MKETNEIDQLFEESLGGLTAEPSAEAWSNIVSGLDAAAASGTSSSTSGAKYLLWVLMGTVAAILASIFFFNQNSNEIKSANDDSLAKLNSNVAVDTKVEEQKSSDDIMSYESQNAQEPNETTIESTESAKESTKSAVDNTVVIPASTKQKQVEKAWPKNNAELQKAESEPDQATVIAENQNTSEILAVTTQRTVAVENSEPVKPELKTNDSEAENMEAFESETENSKAAIAAATNTAVQKSEETNSTPPPTEPVQSNSKANTAKEETSAANNEATTPIVTENKEPEKQQEETILTEKELTEPKSETTKTEETKTEEIDAATPPAQDAVSPSPSEVAGTHFATGWSIDLFGGPAWIFNTEKIQVDEGHTIYPKSMEDILTPSMGFNLKYHVNNWFVQSGLSYSEYGENKNYIHNIEMHDTTGYPDQNINEYYSYDSVGFYIDPNNPTVVITLYDAIKHTDTTYTWISEDSLYYEHQGIYAQNRYRYIEIPVMLGYEFRFKNLGVEVSTGVSFGFRVNSSGKFLDSKNELIDINTENSPYSNSMMNYILIVGVKYHLTNRLSVIAQPIYKTNINSIFTSGQSTSYNNFGLNVGLNYTIK